MNVLFKAGYHLTLACTLEDAAVLMEIIGRSKIVDHDYSRKLYKETKGGHSLSIEELDEPVLSVSEFDALMAQEQADKEAQAQVVEAAEHADFMARLETATPDPVVTAPVVTVESNSSDAWI